MTGTFNLLFCDLDNAVDLCCPSTIQATLFPSGKIGNSKTPGSEVSLTPSGTGPLDCLKIILGSKAKIMALGNNILSCFKYSTILAI